MENNIIEKFYCLKFIPDRKIKKRIKKWKKYIPGVIVRICKDNPELYIQFANAKYFRKFFEIAIFAFNELDTIEERFECYLTLDPTMRLFLEFLFEAIFYDNTKIIKLSTAAGLMTDIIMNHLGIN